MIPWIASVCLVAAQAWLLRRLRFDWVVVALVLAGTLVSLNYLGYTPLAERNYDGPAHAEYIRLIAKEGRLPPALGCVVCGHPPLYYVLAAGWSRLVHAGVWVPRDLGLQWFSLLLSFGFEVFALLLLRSHLSRPASLRLAAALVVLWPSTIINSVRVHNDALASLLILAAMHFTSQWDRQGRGRDFGAALAACALALLTKATGYAVASALLLFALVRLRSHGFDRANLRPVLAAAVILPAVALLATSLRQADKPLSPCQHVLGRACDPGRSPPSPFRPLTFVGFDVSDFVSHTNAVNDDPAQDYFLNRLLKSSLFGVARLGPDFASPRHRILAVVISVALLAMLALSLFTLAFARQVSWPTYRTLALTSVLMLVFLVVFRLVLPNPFHDDFRHIFPMLVPLCLGYAKVVERLARWSRALHATSVVLALVMIVASLAFFVRI